MKYFIFNYSHDLALACGMVHYNVSSVVDMMERDLRPLAAFMSEAGDTVWVAEDRAAACRRYYASHFAGKVRCSFDTVRAGIDQLCRISSAVEGSKTIVPWGWDYTLKRYVQGQTYDRPALEPLLPSHVDLANIRELSSRQTAVRILARLRDVLDGRLCGESWFCTKEEEIKRLMDKFDGRLMLKAPWSSSGRGVRFGAKGYTPYLVGWIRNVLAAQGGVEVEPMYDKLSDWAAEFMACSDGHVEYRGLSHFHTTGRCSYVANEVASQARLQENFASEYSWDKFCEVVQVLTELIDREIAGRYVGPLGVDMMLCRDQETGGIVLHPCVEINLRHTMGQLAIRLEPLANSVARCRFVIRYAPTPRQLSDWLQAQPQAQLDADYRLIQGCLPLVPRFADSLYTACLIAE